MSSRFLRTSYPLAVGLAMACPAFVHAQVNPNNANLSTGSGAGTSISPNSLPSGTSVLRGSTGTGSPRPGYGQVIAPGSQQPGMNPGGGIDPTSGLPAAMDGTPYANLTQAQVDAIDAGLLDDARKITTPADRAMAMDRVAMVKITSHSPGDNRLAVAHDALAEGSEAALRVEDRVTRDIRLRLLVRTQLMLADELTREATTDTSVNDRPNAQRIWSARHRYDLLLSAEQEREAAANIASRIANSTLRSEMLFRVVDNASTGSQEVASKSLLSSGSRTDLRGMSPFLDRMADRGLVFAGNTAGRIDKPIWRDRSMVSIAIAAAASEQFRRGVEISRTIPQPEYRSDALIRLAEAEARRSLNADATQTYREAAAAVAAIPIDDPRATLASVLIDSLISVGRFDDARACVPFYPDKVRQLNALGTIAENQGERRLSQSAFAWIDRDAPPELRDSLRLRVNAGILHSFEKSRPNNPGGMGNDASAR